MDSVTATADVFFLFVRAFQPESLPLRPKPDVAMSSIPINHNRIEDYMQNNNCGILQAWEGVEDIWKALSAGKRGPSMFWSLNT